MDNEADCGMLKKPRRHPTMMMSVAAMLNPVEDHQIPSPASTCPEKQGVEPPNRLLKKQKLAKDAPIFAEGSPTGDVRFPPYDDFRESDRKEMARFNIYPALEDIGTFPRHIPYSSDKKDFLQKTGREAFEVFQYTFQVPTDERIHTVMWDYNVGLVRITPFFKCRRFAKTVPGKMLASNPGLKSVCHSITGGALAAQGYWMPFSAARALAGTFCYHIRYALLPLFGHEFAADCLTPKDSDYQEMIIDRSIVEDCVQEAALMRCEVAASAQKFNDVNRNAYGAFTPTPTATESSSSRPGTPLTFYNTFDKPFVSSVEKDSQDKVKRHRSGNNAGYQTSPDVSQSCGRGRRHGFIALSSPSSDLHSSKSDRGLIPRSHEPACSSEFEPMPRANELPSSPAVHSSLDRYSTGSWRSASELSDRPPWDPKLLPRLSSLFDEWSTSSSQAKTSLATSRFNERWAEPRDEALAVHSDGSISAKYEPTEEELRAAWVLWQIHLAESGSRKELGACRDLAEAHVGELQRLSFEGVEKRTWALSSSSTECQEMKTMHGRKRRAST